MTKPTQRHRCAIASSSDGEKRTPRSRIARSGTTQKPPIAVAKPPAALIGTPHAGSQRPDASRCRRTSAWTSRTRTLARQPSAPGCIPPGAVTATVQRDVSASRRGAIRSSLPVAASGRTRSAAW